MASAAPPPDGKAKGGVKFDICAVPPEAKPKLTSVIGVKRHMGLVRDVAGEDQGGEDARAEAAGGADNDSGEQEGET